MHLNDGRVVSNFVAPASQNADVIVYGDGTQTRSFCYVDDLIRALRKLMEMPRQWHEADGFPYPVNIGNPVEFSILELTGCVIEVTGSRSKPKFKPLPSDDPPLRRLDISRATKLLSSWGPKTSLVDGISCTATYFDDILGKPNAPESRARRGAQPG